MARSMAAKRAYMKKWATEHREYLREYGRKYRAKHRDRINARLREYCRKNKAQVRAKHRELSTRYRQEIIRFFGGKCIRCGFSDWRALQLDHINGDGWQEKLVTGVRRTHTRWKFTREHPEKARRLLQLLCANCNWIKRYERNENPGQRIGHADHHEARKYGP